MTSTALTKTLAVTLLATTSSLHAAVAANTNPGSDAAKTICVYDVGGNFGLNTSLLKDYQLFALQNGVTVKTRSYSDEHMAAEDFKTGSCDALLATGIRVRQFNRFTGSLDALGGISTFEEARVLSQLIQDKRFANKMVEGSFEVAGMLPVGPAYPFVRDRSINHVRKLSGRRILALEFDPAQAAMIERVGAAAVANDGVNFAAPFNNGAVDMIAMPPVAYKPFELYRGLKKNGAVVKYPLAMISYQMVIRKQRFPEDFAAKSRTYMATQADSVIALAKRAESDIPSNQWLTLSAQEESGYDELLRDARNDLRNEGIYDRTAITLLKRVRCQVNKTRGECSSSVE